MPLLSYLGQVRLRVAGPLAALGAIGAIVGAAHEYAGALYYVTHDLELFGYHLPWTEQAHPGPAAVVVGPVPAPAPKLEPTTLTLAKFFPDRVTPLPGMSVQRVADRMVYPRGAELRFSLTHAGAKPAVVTRIRAVSEQVAPKVDLRYEIDPSQTVALGQVQPSIYYILVGRSGVSQAFETGAGQGHIVVDPDNLLVRNGIPTEIRLSGADGEDHRMIVWIRAVDPGLYQVRFEVTYEADGAVRTETSERVDLYEQ